MNYPFYELDRDENTALLFEKRELKYFTEHYHKKLEIYYVLEGSIELTINGAPYSFKKDEIAFIPEFYAHGGIRDYKKNMVLVLIPSHNITTDIKVLLKHKTLPCKMSDTIFNKSVILPVLLDMDNDSQKEKEIIAKGYINIIIGNLFYHYDAVDIKFAETIDFIVNVLKYIDVNYYNKLSLDSLSKVFGYNKYYFSRQFNKLVKMNLNDYINFVRLQKFYELYMKSDGSKITKIAFDCGFDSLSTFYRAFSQTFNLSPYQYFNKLKSG